MPLIVQRPWLMPALFGAAFLACCNDQIERPRFGLHLIDGFCGQGNLGATANLSGLSAQGWDAGTGSRAQRVGWLAVAGKVMSVSLVTRCIADRSVAWLGPPCPSWVWMTRFRTKRSPENVSGDASAPFVREANSLADWLAQFLLFLHSVNVHFVLEQPLLSLLPRFHAVWNVLQLAGAQRITLKPGPYGSPTPKPLQL